MYVFAQVTPSGGMREPEARPVRGRIVEQRPRPKRQGEVAARGSRVLYAQPMPNAIPPPPPRAGRWLDGVKVVPTLNRGGPLSGLPPLIVIHYTAGRSAANTIRRFTDPASQVSAHFVIAENGEVAQMVDLARKAWHAGQSAIRLPSGSTLRALNAHSIGIELDYDGWLPTLNAGRRARSPADAIQVNNRWWPLYLQTQVDALVRVIDEIRLQPENDQWVASPCYLVGHEDIAPGRKLDPGPAFPWHEVTERTQLTRLRAID